MIVCFEIFLRFYAIEFERQFELDENEDILLSDSQITTVTPLERADNVIIARSKVIQAKWAGG